MIGRKTRVILVVLLAFVAATVVTARPGDRAIYPAVAPAQTVYVINNGFHTDIAVPAKALAQRGGALAQAAAAVPPDPWMVIGWGDASFYTARGISPARVGDGLRALFRPGNPSVIRIFGVSRDPAQAYAPGAATPVALSEAGLARLLDRMEASMSISHGAPVRARTQTTPDEVFFDSVEHFSLLRMCNHWTADMLAAGGLPTTPMLDGLAPGLMADLSLRAGVRAAH